MDAKIRFKLIPSFLLVAATVLLYVAVQLHFDRASMYVVTGDEPHYIINGLSIAEDRDLRLDNNYQQWHDSQVVPMFPHVYKTQQGWYPFRGLGVPVLVALPAMYFGPVGARVAMAAFAALFTLAGLFWIRRTIEDGELATLAFVAFFWALPFLAAAGLVFPDMLTGGICFTALVLLNARTTAAWPALTGALFSLSVCALVFVYWRQLPVLFLFAGLSAFRSLTLSGFSIGQFRQFFRSPAGRRELWVQIPIAVAAVLTLLYVAANDLLSQGDGFFGLAPASRALETFIGSHIDQNHGLLWRNPLLWLALPGWYLLYRDHRFLFFGCVLLYVFLLLPQCVADMMYGAHGVAGRYTWNIVWLWLLPFFLVIKQVASLQGNARRALDVVLIAGVGLQLLLALHWLSPAYGDLLMRDNVQPDLAFVNNLFGEFRFILPAFNFTQSAENSVNWWWAFVFFSLLLIPFVYRRVPTKRVLITLAAFSVLVTLGVSLHALERRSAIITIELPVKTLPLTADKGFVAYGVACQLARGRYAASFEILAPAGGGAFDIHAFGLNGFSQRITAGMLPISGSANAATQTVEFTVPANSIWPTVNFNVWTEGQGPVVVRAIRLSRLGPLNSRAQLMPAETATP